MAARGHAADPRAWLISTGCFKAIDAMRRRARFNASQVEIAERLEAEDSAQALIAGAGPGSGDAVKGRTRSTSSRDPATAARIARIAPWSSTVAIKRRRRPQRGHASASMSKAHRIRSAHAQWRPLAAGVGSSLASEHALATAGASAGGAP